jgi:putative tricarboxylic transport membrane protein
MEHILQGLMTGLSPTNLLFAFLGCASGIIFGALPGISAAMGVVLLLPFTYGMDGTTAIILLVTNFCGSTFGGSITSILFATPGTPESVMTVLDGHPMHKKGQGGKALGLAVSSSVIGGLFSACVMVVLCVPLSRAAMEFGSAEYVALGILGVTAMAGLGSGSMLKTLISGCLGLVLATFGTDEVTGAVRFSFGSSEFVNGVHFIPVMIGAFALSEVFMQAIEFRRRKTEAQQYNTGIKVEFMSWVEFLRYKWVLLKSAVLGMVIGVLPGTGGTIASVLAYSEVVRSSKDKEKFGTGMPEGVIAPETANNASTGGAMVPTLTLGIPGSGTTAVILGAFIMHGMRPGPLLFQTQPTLLYGVFVSMILANLMLFFGGIYGVKIFAQVSRFPYYLQGPLILMLCFVGSYALGVDIFNSWIMLLAGVVGFFMKKYKFNVAALVLGLVLGSLIEENIRKMMIISGDDWSVFFTRPISGTIFLVAAGTLLWPLIQKLLDRRKAAAAGKN